MFKNKKRGLYSKNIEVTKCCATCKFGRPLFLNDDVMCNKYGPVSSNHLCKKYDYNRLMKRPPKKRKIKDNNYNPDDFSID